MAAERWRLRLFSTRALSSACLPYSSSAVGALVYCLHSGCSRAERMCDLALRVSSFVVSTTRMGVLSRRSGGPCQSLFCVSWKTRGFSFLMIVALVIIFLRTSWAVESLIHAGAALMIPISLVSGACMDLWYRRHGGSCWSAQWFMLRSISVFGSLKPTRRSV